MTEMETPKNLMDRIDSHARAVTVVNSVRDIETITGEILSLKQTAGDAILGIGQRLIEAKELLSHGEWLPWLNERVEFSERTATRFMRLAREWTNQTTLSDLGASKALMLLALPEMERDQFISEPHLINGQEKVVIDMSVRELEKAIRERKDALKALEEANAKATAAEESRAKMETDMRMARQLLDVANTEKGAITAEVTAFKFHLAAWQQTYTRMMELLKEVPELDRAKLQAAVAAQMEQWSVNSEED